MPDERPDERPGGKDAWVPSTLRVMLQPEERELELPRAGAKNVARLLETLGLRRGTAIVARDGVLLTPDVPLYPGQNILVRKVMSSG